MERFLALPELSSSLAELQAQPPNKIHFRLVAPAFSLAYLVLYPRRNFISPHPLRGICTIDFVLH
jgi:hypothetical protein